MCTCSQPNPEQRKNAKSNWPKGFSKFAFWHPRAGKMDVGLTIITYIYTYMSGARAAPLYPFGQGGARTRDIYIYIYIYIYIFIYGLIGPNKAYKAQGVVTVPTMYRTMDRTMNRTMDRTMGSMARRTMDRTMDRTMNRTMDRTMDRTMGPMAPGCH